MTWFSDDASGRAELRRELIEFQNAQKRQASADERVRIEDADPSESRERGLCILSGWL